MGGDLLNATCCNRSDDRQGFLQELHCIAASHVQLSLSLNTNTGLGSYEMNNTRALIYDYLAPAAGSIARSITLAYGVHLGPVR